MSNSFSMPDCEMTAGLSHMAAMPRYTSWVMSFFLPFLHGKIIEIGAGIGTYIPYYQAVASSVFVLEPDPLFASRIRKSYPDVVVIESPIEKLDAKGAGLFDAVICINSLEHFADDRGVIRRLSSMLAVGGRLCIYVPARPELFSEWDRSVGHYRRYTKSSLGAIIANSNLTIRYMCYTDLLGGLGWYVSGRLGVTPAKQDASFSKSMSFFDNYCVPVQRLVERMVPMIWGKTLVCVAEQVDDGLRSY